MAYRDDTDTRREHEYRQQADREPRPVRERTSNYGLRALGALAAAVLIWVIFAALWTRPIDNLPPQADPAATQPAAPAVSGAE